MMKIKFLSDNKTERGGCLAEWGLSIYIETEEMKLLMDAGASAEVFLHNAREMKVDLSEVEAMVISHGHFDHTNGVPAFCRINTKAPIYIQKEGLIQSYDLPSGVDEAGHPRKSERSGAIGLLWTEEEWELTRPRLIPTDGVTKLTENIVLAGELKPPTEFVPTETFYRETFKGSGSYEPDPMHHEQILVIRRPEGLFVFSGCSHTGIEACVHRARELFPEEKIALLVAGLHLIAAPEGAGTAAAALLKQLGVEQVMPMHCTGQEAICEIKAAMGECCKLPYAGVVYRFD